MHLSVLVQAAHARVGGYCVRRADGKGSFALLV